MMNDTKIGVHQFAGCEVCKLNVADRTWRVPGDFNYNAKFLFVAEQFQPTLAGKLKKLLRACDFPTDDIEIAYLTRCNAGEEVKAQIREGQHCKPLFDRLLSKVSKDTVVVTLGATPCKVVAGKKSILVAHGTVGELDGRICVPTLHPAQVIAYPDSLPTFVEDMGKILDAGNGVFTEVAKTNYTLVDTVPKFKEMIKTLWAAPAFSFDIESTSLDPYKDVPHKPAVLMFSFSCASKTAYALPVDHKEAPWTRKKRDYILKWVERLLSRGPEEGVTKVPHNGQFDTKYLRGVYGWEVTNDFDTLLAHYTAITEEKGTHGLKILAWQFTDMGGYDDPLDEYKQAHPEADPERGGNYGEIPLDTLWKYAAADADCTFRLYEEFYPKVEDEFKDLFYNIVMPATNALGYIESTGAPIDMQWLKHCQTEYPRLLNETLDRLREFPEVLRLEKILTKQAKKKKQAERVKRFKTRADAIAELRVSDPGKAEKAWARLQVDVAKAKQKPVAVVPTVYNPKSPVQNKMLLFEIMGLKPTKKSKGGGWSTDKEVLKDLYGMAKHPIIQNLGKFIKMKTLYSMFVDGLDAKLCRDGRLRGHHLVFGTETGRLSMSDPNLQQIPKNPKEDAFVDVKLPSIKKLFAAPKGYCILQFDYSQAELRVLAALSGEPTLRDAYEKGEDVHRRVASEAYEVEQDEVTEQQRHAAKTINFGLIYGQGAAKLAKTIGCSEQEAKDFIAVYFKKLPMVKKWIARMKARVRQDGFIKSPYGRIRRLASVFSPEQDIVAKAERQGVNAPIQATASDCTLQSIARIVRYFKNKEMKSRIIITVHDSIVMLVWLPEVTRVYNMVKKIMSHPPNSAWLKGVPMVADAEVGLDWGTLTKVESAEDLAKAVSDFPR